MAEMNPIRQFQVTPLLGGEGPIHGIVFTNSAFFMFLAVALVTLLMLGATASRAVVPGRWQSMAESLYEFVAGTVRSSAGTEGMRFFPFVFTLFVFVLFANLIGLIPGFFTVTSHLIVTFALAALVILTVIVYGFIHNGLGFLRLFVPSGVPVWLMPLLVLIEVVSFVSRPISLSVRLFANMLAGHIALQIFAGFVVALGTAGVFAVLSPLPLLLTVALMALEFLVAVLQAYVFATLTCIYLNDALHPHH